MKNKLLIISGPTGSGKTDLALKLSKDLDRRIVNADPFQFYNELRIIGNQPDEGVDRFEFMGFRSVAEPINAGGFSKLANVFLKPDFIWVGTGLYLGASLYGLDEDRRKGTPFQGEAKVDYEMIVLDPDRQELYQRLNDRVDLMMKKGAETEAQKIFQLIERGCLESKNPILKAIGLQHLLKVIAKDWTLSAAIELWKRDTRRLAKRQWTWLRKFCPPSDKVTWKRHLLEN